MSFKGTFSVTITPTQNNGDINIKSLQNYFNWQIKKKIGGLIILGSTGEFLSINKKNRLIMIKEFISEFVWYLLTGFLVISITTNYILEQNCA